MTDQNKQSPVQYITRDPAIRLTNLFFRVVIVFTFRLLTATVLGIARIVQRRRTTW